MDANLSGRSDIVWNWNRGQTCQNDNNEITSNVSEGQTSLLDDTSEIASK